MKTALGYGLVLLAALATVPLALASPGTNFDEPFAPTGAQFYVGGSSSGTPLRAAQGYLGVDVRDISPDQVAALRLRDSHGAEIVLVDHDAPAGKAGLREHDVVLQMNGQPITGEDQIRRMLHESPPGRTITLLISRDGQQITVTTQMANREEVERQAWEQHLTVPEPQTSASDAPDSNAAPTPAAPGGPAPRAGNSFIGNLMMSSSYTGAILEKMSTQQADFFGVPSATAGLLVRSVIPNSPAALAGIHVCDVVLKADDHVIASTGDWAKAMKNSHGHPVAVVVMRDKKEQTLTLTPDSKHRSSLAEPAGEADPVIARIGFSWLPRS